MMTTAHLLRFFQDLPTPVTVAAILRVYFPTAEAALDLTRFELVGCHAAWGVGRLGVVVKVADQDRDWVREAIGDAFGLPLFDQVDDHHGSTYLIFRKEDP